MSKDFSQFLGEKKNQSDYEPPVSSQDPNLFVNDQQSKEISVNNSKLLFANTATILSLNFLTAPLTTIYVSLQQSVLPHKNKYGDVQPEEQLKALMKTTKEITPQERRKYELIIKSGMTGQNRPFQAPVYSGYFEVIKALANQGLLGFFKGYWAGCQYAVANSYFRFIALNKIDYEWAKIWHNGQQALRLGIVFTTTTALDIALNPLMMMQSRFIIQNRLPNFLIYKSQNAFLRKHLMMSPREFWKGGSTHIFKNLFLFGSQLIGTFIGTERAQLFYNSLVSQLISYPWLTVLRRLHCQSKLPGMIPPRYLGAWHGFVLILNEEGIRGLYRGFGAFLIANSFATYILYFNQFHGQEEIIFE